MKEIFSAAQAQSNPGLKDAFGNILTNTASDAGYGTGPDRDILATASSVIFAILYLLGTIFLMMILYSGIRWMTAGGNEAAMDRAKSTIKHSIIGLIIVVAAYALSYFFTEVLM